MRIRNVGRFNRQIRVDSDTGHWDYKPTPRQKQAHMAPERYKLYGGAVGGGKSVWLCAEVITQLLKYPGNRAYMCRNALIDLRLSTLVTFEKICKREFIAKHQQEDHTIIFNNGSELVYGGLGGLEELDKIKSREFGLFAIDEATECDEEHFLLLCSRLRWKLPDGTHPNYFGLLASNPEPGWVKDRFVDQKLEDHVFIPALPRDNPHLPHDYDAKLRKLFPLDACRRYLDGSWDVFEGQIYKEFDKERHVFDHDVFQSQKNSQYFDRFRVIDHGYRNPTCCLWIAIDFDGNMWVYDEHYETQLTISENAEIIRRKHEGDFITLCDPSMFSRTLQAGTKIWSAADEYRENGVMCIKPYAEGGHMSEMNGINLVKQRFKANQLFVHSSCRNTIDEIIKYKWKTTSSLKPTQSGSSLEVPIDRHNHAVDCLRYACLWRPPSSDPPKIPLPTNSLHWAILDHKKLLNSNFYAGWN